MKALKLTITATAIATLAGCAAKQDITRFEGNNAPKIVCIAEHKEVRQGVISALQTGFAKHNVQTRVIPANYVAKHQEYRTDLLGADTTDCNAIAYYVANWHWDLALYMSYANIWVNDAKTNEKTAQASYRTGGGLDKFINAEEKIIELVDGMY